MDVAAGIVIAEACYYIGQHTKYYQKIEEIFDRVNRKVFGEKFDEE